MAKWESMGGEKELKSPFLPVIWRICFLLTFGFAPFVGAFMLIKHLPRGSVRFIKVLTILTVIFTTLLNVQLVQIVITQQMMI